jgi:hypothetical protein
MNTALQEKCHTKSCSQGNLVGEPLLLEKKAAPVPVDQFRFVYCQTVPGFTSSFNSTSILKIPLRLESYGRGVLREVEEVIWPGGASVALCRRADWEIK